MQSRGLLQVDPPSSTLSFLGCDNERPKKKPSGGKSQEIEACSLFPLNYLNAATTNFSSFTFSIALGSLFILIPISS